MLSSTFKDLSLIQKGKDLTQTMNYDQSEGAHLEMHCANSEVLYKLLLFIYSGKRDVIGTFFNTQNEVILYGLDDANVFDLLESSSYYGIELLANCCEKYLISNMKDVTSKDNLHHICEKYNLQKLQKALDRVAKGFCQKDVQEFVLPKTKVKQLSKSAFLLENTPGTSQFLYTSFLLLQLDFPNHT